jgi:hypothetical protein
VIYAGVPGSGVNSAIPVHKLLAFLSKPEIQFDSPVIQFKDSHEPTELTFRVVRFSEKAQPVTMELDWESSILDHRHLVATPATGGLYKLKLVPVPKMEGPPKVMAIVHFPLGKMECIFDDGLVKLDGADIKLSHIKKLAKQDGQVNIELAHGPARSGKVFVAEPSMVEWGGFQTRVDLNKAMSFELLGVGFDNGLIAYNVKAVNRGVELAKLSGHLVLEGRPGVPTAGGFIGLGSNLGLAQFLSNSDFILYQDNGIRTSGRKYVRTSSADFNTGDFVLDVVFSMGKDDDIAYIGLGEGIPAAAYEEPQNSVNFRVHPPHVINGEVMVSKVIGSGETIGLLSKYGTHCARIEKKGDTVTFSIDVDFDGKFSSDFSKTIPNIKEFAPFLVNGKSFFFFGGGGTFEKVQLTRQR